MHELVVISGKGGTGKTSLTAAFAALAENLVLADCDVDAPDLHLLLQPEVRRQSPFISGKTARIVEEACVRCGGCVSTCRFEAIEYVESRDPNVMGTWRIDPILCEGCGVCVRFCPSSAIVMDPSKKGDWYISDTRHGQMVHATLGIAEDNSGKLVSLIRREARALAQQSGKELILTDGPPGIGCPVIASIGGASLVLIVVEPTVSSLHDLRRVVELTTHFKVPASICINKSDINPDIIGAIESQAAEGGIPIVGRIGYDESFVAAQTAGQSIVEYGNGQIVKALKTIWHNVKHQLGQRTEVTAS